MASSGSQIGFRESGTIRIPDSGRCGNATGIVVEESREFTQSRELFSKVYDRSARLETALGLAAQALHHLERYKESNSLFKQVTEQNAKDYETWVAWGNLFLEKYNPSEAASVFSDVLKLNPKHPEALLGLALCRGDSTGEEVEKIWRKPWKSIRTSKGLTSLKLSLRCRLRLSMKLSVRSLSASRSIPAPSKHIL